MDILVDVFTTGLIMLAIGGLVIAAFALIEYIAYWVNEE